MSYRGSRIKIFVLIGVVFLAVFSVYADTAEEYFHRGLADSKQHNFGQAIIDFTKSIEINPNYANAYVNRGNAYDYQGNFSQAILDYTKASEINPKDADIYYNRALAYFDQKNFAKAWEDVHKAKSLGAKIDPRFLEALKKASGREK
jgi:tetratricopeptide (TPR) repeat protein